jgi:hypothetical protein
VSGRLVASSAGGLFPSYRTASVVPSSVVALCKARLTSGSLPACRWALVLTLCLGVGLPLTMPGAAWGISGYAGGQTAVGAQYPDSAAGQSAGPKPDIANLVAVMQSIRRSERRDPAQWHASQRKVNRGTLQALSGGAGAGLRQTGSIALLIAAIVVVLVGAVLRWRRGDAQTG